MKAYPATTYAKALNVTKRAVLLAIGQKPATDTRKIRGQSAKAWASSILPTILRAKLETAATGQNFPTVAALLDYHDAHETPAIATPPPVKAFRLEDAIDLHAAVTDAAEIIVDKSSITAAEKENVWKVICENVAALNLPRGDLAALKHSLSVWLAKNVPGLDAAVRTIERKLADATKRTDNRTRKSGNYRAPLCPECWEKLLRLNIDFGGTESLAWRQIKKKTLLCAECDQKHTFNIRKAKSQVPHSIRNRLTSITEDAREFGKSDSAGRMAGPHIERDWSGVNAGDWWVGDDVTWNHEVWTTDNNGRTYLCRPECLYLADARTSYPIHFILIPGQQGSKASYNADHVRLLMLQAHDLLGLPNRGFLFENGVWRARAVRDSQAGDKWSSWAETELGLKNLKHFVEIRHAKPRTPRAKTVEGDFHILQNLMRRLPGHVGANERADKTDRIRRAEADFRRRVKEGKEHPGNEFMSLTQFRDALTDVFAEFADEPQNGKRLPGISPREGWGNPLLRKLPDEARWIYATRREQKIVTADGLIVNKLNYCNAELRKHRGEEVWAFYNLEYPEILTVCDRKREHYFSVTLPSAPAMDARATHQGRAALKQSQLQIDDFNRTAKTIAGSIRHERVANVERDYDASEADRTMGREIAANVETHRTAKREQTNARNRRMTEGDRMMRAALAELETNTTPEDQ